MVKTKQNTKIHPKIFQEEVFCCKMAKSTRNSKLFQVPNFYPVLLEKIINNVKIFFNAYLKY
jgi:hypothetical protein